MKRTPFQHLLVDRLHRSPVPVRVLGFDVTRHVRAGCEGFEDAFVDLPIAEETILGAAIGLARCGVEPIVDLMFEGFGIRALEPLATGALHSKAGIWRSTVATVTVRAMAGPFTGAGLTHSGVFETLLAQLRHLHVTAPVTAADLLAAHGQAAACRSPLIVLDPAMRPGISQLEVVPSRNEGAPSYLRRVASHSPTLTVVGAQHASVASAVTGSDVLYVSSLRPIDETGLAGVIAHYQRVVLLDFSRHGFVGDLNSTLLRGHRGCEVLEFGYRADGSVNAGVDASQHAFMLPAGDDADA